MTVTQSKLWSSLPLLQRISGTVMQITRLSAAYYSLPKAFQHRYSQRSVLSCSTFPLKSWSKIMVSCLQMYIKQTPIKNLIKVYWKTEKCWGLAAAQWFKTLWNICSSETKKVYGVESEQSCGVLCFTLRKKIALPLPKICGNRQESVWKSSHCFHCSYLFIVWSWKSMSLFFSKHVFLCYQAPSNPPGGLCLWRGWQDFWDHWILTPCK